MYYDIIGMKKMRGGNGMDILNSITKHMFDIVLCCE